MKNSVLFKKTALAASIALLTACSGSDTTTSASATDGTSVGVVTGFGSIYVNGVEYETDNAIITIDGKIALETDIGVGDICVVDGTVNPDGLTGTAISVTCTDELEGYVTDTSGLLNGVGTIVVMGQTVNITLDTVFDSDTYASIDQLMVDNIVEISGFSDGAGTVVATRVETKSDIDNDIEIKGLVSNLLDTTFTIGTLVVDYSTVSSMPVLTEGLYVEVKADTAPVDNAGVLTLTATYIEIEEDGDMDIDGDSGQELNVTGLVSDLVESGFTFNGSTFIDYASVDIEDTFVITEGMTITVEGYIDENGVFIPEEVVEEPETEAETYGYVTAFTEGTISISMDDGVTVETFTVNNDTRMIDELYHDQYFNFTDVTVGVSYVEIEYYTIVDSGEKVATEVELEDAPANEPVIEETVTPILTK